MEPWSVHEYSIEKLTKLLSGLSQADPDTVRDKLHRRYFKDYLPEIGVKTLVVENDYVDRDFLEDYAAYYVRCFNDYDRFCSRIHFFAESFCTDDFEQTLEEPDVDFKRDVAQAEPLQPTYRRTLLEESMPRFIWRAIARVGSSPVLELVFDATDIEQGSMMCRGVEYLPSLGAFLRKRSERRLGAPGADERTRGIYEWFADQPPPT